MQCHSDATDVIWRSHRCSLKLAILKCSLVLDFLVKHQQKILLYALCLSVCLSITHFTQRVLVGAARSPNFFYCKQTFITDYHSTVEEFVCTWFDITLEFLFKTCISYRPRFDIVLKYKKWNNCHLWIIENHLSQL